MRSIIGLALIVVGGLMACSAVNMSPASAEQMQVQFAQICVGPGMFLFGLALLLGGRSSRPEHAPVQAWTTDAQAARPIKPAPFETDGGWVPEYPDEPDQPLYGTGHGRAAHPSDGHGRSWREQSEWIESRYPNGHDYQVVRVGDICPNCGGDRSGFGSQECSCVEVGDVEVPFDPYAVEIEEDQ